MKKIFMFMAAVLAFAACEQFNEIKDVKPIEAVSFNVGISLVKADSIPAPDQFRVKLNNYAENIEIIKYIASGETLEITDVIPGIYTVSISGESHVGDFRYVFNGNLSNEAIIENGTKFNLEMAAAKTGNIILKEIYYCGSKIGGKTSYFRDQYYELYNNSNTVQYLDGLCIGNINPASTSSIHYVWDRENQEDYIYFQTIWQIPFDRNNPDNKMYPLQPGESVIIAQMAHDHRTPDLNPDCPVDLSEAEFEFYLKTTAYTKDNPAHNMVGAFWKLTTSWWLVNVNGGAYAIFYPDEQMQTVMYEPNYEELYASTWVTPIGYTTKGKDVHIDYVIDAVELMLNETKITQKRMPAILDAGATWVGGTYLAKSVTRKVSDIMEDGRVIYQDTNNSLEDFEVVDPVLRRNGAGRPSWNTWAN